LSFIVKRQIAVNSFDKAARSRHGQAKQCLQAGLQQSAAAGKWRICRPSRNRKCTERQPHDGARAILGRMQDNGLIDWDKRQSLCCTPIESDYFPEDETDS
jgi:hypothetical protein